MYLLKVSKLVRTRSTLINVPCRFCFILHCKHLVLLSRFLRKSLTCVSCPFASVNLYSYAVSLQLLYFSSRLIPVYSRVNCTDTVLPFRPIFSIIRIGMSNVQIAPSSVNQATLGLPFSPAHAAPSFQRIQMRRSIKLIYLIY